MFRGRFRIRLSSFVAARASPGLRFAALASVALLASEATRAAGFRIFQSTAVLGGAWGSARPEEFGLWDWAAPTLPASVPAGEDFQLDLQFPVLPEIDPKTGLGSGMPVAKHQPRRFWITATSAAAILGSAYNAFSEYPD
ncbi:MAG: hypothetical protein ACRD1Z_04650, partial [Vicinamibacteria bacterium]